MSNPTAPRVKDPRLLEGTISLVAEILLKSIMAEAAAACESWTVVVGPVVAELRSLDDGLCEHRARGEREKRQSCDQGFHFQSPSFDWNAERPYGACRHGDPELFAARKS